MISTFAEWRQLIDNKYGVSYKNDIVNNNIYDLRNMKDEIDDKIKNIQNERQTNLNILKKEMAIKMNQFQTELKDMKKEIDEQLKKMNENKTQHQYFRKNKRKHSEME
jgi:hypothetical protein